jgi:hypothetical protein
LFSEAHEKSNPFPVSLTQISANSTQCAEEIISTDFTSYHPCSSALDRIVYSYRRSINGFAARLTEQERQKLSTMEGVVSVFPSRTYQLQTTRSWDFLGLPRNARRSLPTEGEVIVGMLDTGVWPDSPSFSDDGLGPPPGRWKGACHNFTCNKYARVSLPSCRAPMLVG